MKDAELRGLILQKFYDVRHTTHNVSLSTLTEIEPNKRVVGNICDQLAQHSLINWNPVKTGAGISDGVGSISANGVDVIEGTAASPITITVHDQSVSVTGSTNVQIGNSNIQKLDVEKMIMAVNNSTASEAEKQEAQSILERIVSSPLVQTILGTFSGGG